MVKMSTSFLASFRCSSVFLFCDSLLAFHWRIFRSVCVLWEVSLHRFLSLLWKGHFHTFPFWLYIFTNLI